MIDFSELIKQQKDDALKIGWVELEKQEPVWEQIYHQFDFKPSVESADWPSIQEPIPSQTFHIGHYYSENQGSYSSAILDLQVFYLQAFRNILRENEKILALDWQHPCYIFDPRNEFEEWPIPAFPNGDYYIFLTGDLSRGFFGHPWEQTICVMGQELIDQLVSAPEIFIRNKIRENGEAV